MLVFFNMRNFQFFIFFYIGVFILFPLPNQYLVLFMRYVTFFSNPLFAPNFPPSLVGFAFHFPLNVRLD